MHVARTAWQVTSTPEAERYLLLSFGGSPRAQDPVRQRSEESYRRARIRLSDATVRTLARRMQELAEGSDRVAWPSEFLFRRGSQSDADEASISSQLKRLAPTATPRTTCGSRARPSKPPTTAVAPRTASASCSNQSVRSSAPAATGTSPPDRTCLPRSWARCPAQMPMPSRDFFAAVRREWGLVINQESAADTSLATQLDGAGLERNARRAEKLMSDAGLALGLSDRTTMVGERVGRSRI